MTAMKNIAQRSATIIWAVLALDLAFIFALAALHIPPAPPLNDAIPLLLAGALGATHPRTTPPSA